MSRRALVLAVLLGLPGVLLLGGAGPAAAVPIPPVITGNWTVVGTESYDGGSSLVRDNITVTANSTLLLANLTLTMETGAFPAGKWNQAFTVQSGGTLQLENVTINASSSLRGHHYDFRSGAHIRIDRSRLRAHEYLDLGARDSVIERTTLSNFGSYGISVNAAPGPPVLRNLTIGPGRGSGGTGIRVDSTAGVVVDNATFRDLLYGVDIRFANVTLQNVQMTNAWYGVYLVVSGGLVAENLSTSGGTNGVYGWNSGFVSRFHGCHFTGFGSAGVALFGGTGRIRMDDVEIRDSLGGTAAIINAANSHILDHVRISNVSVGIDYASNLAVWNSTLTTTSWSFRSTAGGTATLVNVTANSLSGGFGEFYTVRWFADLAAVWQSSGSTATAVTYTTDSSATGPDPPVAGDVAGEVHDAIITEYTLSGATKTSYNPYSIGGSVSFPIPRSGNLAANIAPGHPRFVVPIDDVPPVINLTAPADGLRTRSSILWVTGSINEPARGNIAVNGQPATLDPVGEFAEKISLFEGPNPIWVNGSDGYGNIAKLFLTVVRDSVAPGLRLDSPAEGQWVNTTNITIRGDTDPGVKLTANGLDVPLDANGGFGYDLPLPAEGDNWIDLVASDDVGNTVGLNRRVERDTGVPVLNVLAPVNGWITSKKTATVSLVASDDAMILLDGFTISLVGGSLLVPVDLVEGTNTFRFQAIDAAGNANATVLRIVRDTTPPLIGVNIPEGGLLQNTTSFRLEIVSEPDASIDVNGKRITTTGRSNLSLAGLKEGETTFLIEVTDFAGNQNDTVRTITVDLQPPVLTITRPRAGSTQSSLAVTIEGEVVGGIGVEVGSSPVVLANSRFSAVVAFDGEGTHSVTVEAWDRAGNRARAVVTVTIDTHAELDVHASRAGPRTFLIEGRTEPGSDVTVGLIRVAVGADGSFSRTIRIERSGTLTVRSVDPAGNAATSNLTLTVTPGSEVPDIRASEGWLGGVVALVILVFAVVIAYLLRSRRLAAGRELEETLPEDGTVPAAEAMAAVTDDPPSPDGKGGADRDDGGTGAPMETAGPPGLDTDGLPDPVPADPSGEEVLEMEPDAAPTSPPPTDVDWEDEN